MAVPPRRGRLRGRAGGPRGPAPGGRERPRGAVRHRPGRASPPRGRGASRGAQPGLASRRRGHRRPRLRTPLREGAPPSPALRRQLPAAGGGRGQRRRLVDDARGRGLGVRGAGAGTPSATRPWISRRTTFPGCAWSCTRRRTRGRPAIDDAGCPATGRGGRVETLAPRWSEAQDANARETWLTLDLGARHQPFLAVEIDVADERFFREVRVEARCDPRRRPVADVGRDRPGCDPSAGARGPAPRVPGDRGGAGSEPCASGSGTGTIDRCRSRAVGASAGRAPALRGVVARGVPADLRLRGSGDPVVRSRAHRGRSRGGALRRNRLASARRIASRRSASRLPWTERHPSLLWGGLLAVVLALGALTYGALRRAG